MYSQWLIPNILSHHFHPTWKSALQYIILEDKETGFGEITLGLTGEPSKGLCKERGCLKSQDGRIFLYEFHVQHK